MEVVTSTSITKKDPRLGQAVVWLQEKGYKLQSDLQTVAGDASNRRYFRLRVNGISRILMDAPPPSEDVRPFIDIDLRLRAAELQAPEVIAADHHNGYLLLEDFGDDLYRDVLNGEQPEAHFPALFELLTTMAQKVDHSDLPDFDTERMGTEMDLFPDWYLTHHRQSVSGAGFDEIWGEFRENVIRSALDQPRCFVHRDFHSCNLLKTEKNLIGIIDFQDAVTGPVSYDFISLIWDRYIQWPRAQLESWMEEFRVSLGVDIEAEQWRRYCDLMGLQRNFKIVGIFARLYYRDDKSGYIEMIPRFYAYLVNTLQRYPEFKPILKILEQAECVP